MKVVNPIGRNVEKLETGANFSGIHPEGCICSSGQLVTLNGYTCATCACSCGSGTVNLTANLNLAKTERVYIND